MHSRFHLIFMFFCLFIFSCNDISEHIGSTALIDAHWKKIPDSWISKALKFNYKKPDSNLIAEFAGLIKPDTLFNPHLQHIDSDYGRVFNLLRVDLDGDGKDEILLMQGWDVSYPYLCVFKQIKNSWYLIYFENIYQSSSLSVACNYAPNKTFYVRRIYDHGSSIYNDGYSFYKLIDKHVYKCLNIINDAHIYGWGLYLNQEVKSSFEFSGDSDDKLSVDYNYNFFPGSINDKDCSWCAHEDISLIKGDNNVFYDYNVKAHQYQLDILKYNDSSEELTAEKIACFGDFGNDSLFVKAYHRQIDTLLKIGTPIQKKILRKYLQLVDKTKTALTQKLEFKTKAGGTSFYGLK